MKHLFVLLIFYSYVSNGQTNYISVSARAVGWTSERPFRNEIKINKNSGEVLVRKKMSHRFRSVTKIISDPSILFLKDSVSFEYLDKLIKRNRFKVEVTYKITFTSHDNSSGLPNYEKSIEFGRPIDDDKEVEKIITAYYKLKAAAFN